MSFRFTVLVLGLVGALASGAIHAESRTMQQYWGDTGLSLTSVFKQHINSIICAESASTMMGCIEGLSAIGQIMPMPTLLIPVSELEKRRAEYTSVQHTFGPIAWVVANPRYETPTTGRGRAADFELTRANREASVAALREMYGQGYIDFDYILSSFHFQFTDPNLEALAAASAINQVLSYSIDPHTRISPTAYDQNQSNDPSENFVGIGVTLSIEGPRPVITQVIAGGPAANAGINVFDEIVSIDGVSTRRQEISVISSHIRGPENTVVTLRIRRSGGAFTIHITRAKIEIQNVTSEMLSFNGGNVAVIHLKSFMDAHGCDSIKREIQTLTSGTNRPSALVLDLRSNGGGYVREAVCMAAIFMGSNKVVFSARTLDGQMIREEKTDQAALTQLPMVTLLDAYSASASELLSGALQDHRRSWIAGQRSFGKGSMQGPSNYEVSGITLWKTTARFYQPSGRTNQIVGISPDFEIAPKPNATADEMFAMREGDLYPNAFGARSEPWQQPRPSEAAAVLSRCNGYEARAAAARSGRDRRAPTTDYQLHAAAQLALCASEVQ